MFMAWLLYGSITKNEDDDDDDELLILNGFIYCLKFFKFGWKHAIKHTYGGCVCIINHFWLMHIECKFLYFDTHNHTVEGMSEWKWEWEREQKKC